MDASNSSKSSDYGVEESRGTVVQLAADEITIRHQDSVLGAIAQCISRVRGIAHQSQLNG